MGPEHTPDTPELSGEAGEQLDGTTAGPGGDLPESRRPEPACDPEDAEGPVVASYEERYRLTGRAAVGLAASLLLIGLGFLWHSPMIFLPIGLILAAFIAQGAGVIDLARRTVAFRADHEGIMLGAVPDKLTVRRGSALFIPWADVEGIVVYPAYSRGPGGRGAAEQCVGIQRRAAAGPLLWGNEQAPGCPVPGVATWATRRITGWRLDRDRLAAVAAAAAPGTAILDAGAGSGAAGPGQQASAPE
jgi:hypothetical protein